MKRTIQESYQKAFKDGKIREKMTDILFSSPSTLKVLLKRGRIKNGTEKTKK